MSHNMFDGALRIDELCRTRWAERTALAYPGVATVRAGTM